MLIQIFLWVIVRSIEAAGAKLDQLVSMMFAGMTFTIFDTVPTGKESFTWQCFAF